MGYLPVLIAVFTFLAVLIAAGGLYFTFRGRRITGVSVELDIDARAESGFICPKGTDLVSYSLHKMTLTNRSDVASGILRVQMQYSNSDEAFPQATAIPDGDETRLRAPGPNPRELRMETTGRNILSMPINISPHESISGWLAFWIPGIPVVEFQKTRKWILFYSSTKEIFRHELKHMSRPEPLQKSRG